jgi:hypothetical protein
MKSSRVRRNAICATLLAFSVLSSSCTTDKQPAEGDGKKGPLTAMFWRTPFLGAHYPEMQEPKISEKRSSFGVAFQGGGNRAAPAALGQIRTLHDLGWIKKVRYISAVSGGSWAAIPYTFLKNCPTVGARNCNQQRFLGVTHSASEVARQIPKLVSQSTRDAFEDGSFLGAISNGQITGKVARAWFTGKFDESYAEALGEIYLEPFGLSNNTKGVPANVFTWRKKDRDRILAENPRLRNTPIHYVERERPYLIAGGTMLLKRTFIGPADKFRMEMTPLYTGVPQEIGYRPANGSQIELGGGFVESFGYDYVTESNDTSGPITKLTLRDPIFGNRTNATRLNYSVSNMVAGAGAAPVEKGVSLPVLRLLAANFGFPEHYIPGPERTPKKRRLLSNKGEAFEKEWAHGDGGHEDNLGLAPLLARQVENILVFANSAVPMDKKTGKGKPREIDRCADGLRDAGSAIPNPDKLKDTNKDIPYCIDMIGGDIPSFFVRTDHQIHNLGLRLVDSDVPQGQEHLRGYYDLLTVAKDLRAKKNLSCKRYHYKPVIAPYSIRSKAEHGPIPSRPYTPMICILFLGMDQAWLGEIKSTTARDGMSKDEIADIQKTLNLDKNWGPKRRRGLWVGNNGFPHIRTFWDTPGYLIHTSRPRLFALSNFTSWKLNEHKKDISDAFGLNGLNLSAP